MPGSKLPIVLVNRDGRQFIRQRPDQVKQTKATKNSAQRFGLLSSLSSSLLTTLSPILPTGSNRWLYQQLLTSLVNDIGNAGDLNNSAHQFSCLDHLRFVKQAGFKNRFSPVIGIDFSLDGVKINIPGFVPAKDVKAPANCRKIALKIMAINFCPIEGLINKYCLEDLDIHYNNSLHPGLHLTLPLAASAGSISILAASLKYDCIGWGANPRATSLPWMPGGIARAIVNKKNL